MPSFRRNLLAIAGGLALAGLFCNPGAAAVTTATWNPSGSVPPLSTAGAFTFNQITVQDISSIYLIPTGANTFSVQETGFLPFAQFTLGGPVLTPGLNATLGATAYGLYIGFTATATLTCVSAGNCQGSFTGVNYTMMGDPGFTTTFGFGGTGGSASASGTAGDVLLSSGSLANCGATSPDCQNVVSLANNVPSAAVTTTFNENLPTQAGFFVAPPANLTLDLLGSFVNNTSEVTCFAATAAQCAGVAYGGTVPAGAPAGTAILFQLGNPVRGGGSITLNVVPEPTTLSIIGMGLLGFAIAARRRSRRNRNV